jgi:transposase
VIDWIRLFSLQETMGSWFLAPLVKALQTLCGVGPVVDATLVTKIGDLSRFRTPKQLMKWLSLAPSKAPSGTRSRRGALAQAGNEEARAMLVESAWSNRLPAREEHREGGRVARPRSKKGPDRGILCPDRAAWVRTLYATNLPCL